MIDGIGDGCADLGGCIVAPVELGGEFLKNPVGCMLSTFYLFGVVGFIALNYTIVKIVFEIFNVSEVHFYGLLATAFCVGVLSFIWLFRTIRAEEPTDKRNIYVSMLSFFWLVGVLSFLAVYLQSQLVVVGGRYHLVEAPSGPGVASRIDIKDTPLSWQAALKKEHLRSWLASHYLEKARKYVLGFDSAWWQASMEDRRMFLWLKRHFPKRAQVEIAIRRKRGSELGIRIKKLGKAAGRAVLNATKDAAKSAAKNLWQRVRKAWRRRPPPR